MIPMDFNSLDIKWTTTVMGQEGRCDTMPNLVFRKDSNGNTFVDEALLEQRNADENRAINEEALAKYTRMQRERLAEIEAELYGPQKRALDPAFRERT